MIINWFTISELEEATDLDRKTFMKTLTRIEDADAVGYYLGPGGGYSAQIVIIADVLVKHTMVPTSINSRYRTTWGAFTHTLLHELCHWLQVDADLALIRPHENPHTIIDEWVCNKVLLPLENDVLGDETGDIQMERLNWSRTRAPPPPILPTRPSTLPPVESTRFRTNDPR